jgi:hypothetical protein
VSHNDHQDPHDDNPEHTGRYRLLLEQKLHEESKNGTIPPLRRLSPAKGITSAISDTPNNPDVGLTSQTKERFDALEGVAKEVGSAAVTLSETVDQMCGALAVLIQKTEAVQADVQLAVRMLKKVTKWLLVVAAIQVLVCAILTGALYVKAFEF